MTLFYFITKKGYVSEGKEHSISKEDMVKMPTYIQIEMANILRKSLEYIQRKGYRSPDFWEPRCNSRSKEYDLWTVVPIYLPRIGR